MLTNWTNNAVVFITLTLLVRGTCSAYSISRAYVTFITIAFVARFKGLFSVSLWRFASRVFVTLLYRA